MHVLLNFFLVNIVQYDYNRTVNVGFLRIFTHHQELVGISNNREELINRIYIKKITPNHSVKIVIRQIIKRNTIYRVFLGHRSSTRACFALQWNCI